MPADQRIRQPTATSAFGSGRREAHDASAFYARFAAPVLDADDHIGHRKAIDEIFCHDASAMPELEDASVALVVTSPPYFAGKEYETALGAGHVPASYAEYLAMLEAVFAECVRVLEPGGRIAVNVANLGRRPYRSLAADVTGILQDRLRLLLRGEVVWLKAKGASGSCAWGSFRSPTNPVLRDLTERIVIAGKGRFDRAQSPERRAAAGLPHRATIGRDEFMEATTDVWSIPTESATRVGHPAPFPVELPQRLIELHTYEGDLVLDPFMGSGSTAVAAVRTGRHFAGYDTDEGYVLEAKHRVEDERERLERDGTAHATATRTADASSLLASAGFRDVRDKVRAAPGIVVSHAATDAAGHTWLFDVVGGATTSLPGLRRGDVLWRSLAKAAVLREREANSRYVLLTAAGPPRAGEGAAAFRTMRGPGRPVHDVIVFGDATDLARLRRLASGG